MTNVSMPCQPVRYRYRFAVHYLLTRRKDTPCSKWMEAASTAAIENRTNTDISNGRQARKNEEKKTMQSGKNPALRFLLPLFCLLSLLLAACGGGSGTGQANGTSSQASKASDDKQIYIRPYSG